MKHQEFRQFIFRLTNEMIKRKAYIKGYGDQFRVMEHDHSPYMNISKQQMKILQHNSVVTRQELIWTLRPDLKPFNHPIDIKLPKNE